MHQPSSCKAFLLCMKANIIRNLTLHALFKFWPVEWKEMLYEYYPSASPCLKPCFFFLRPDLCVVILIISCLFSERLFWRMVLQSSTDLGWGPFLLRCSLLGQRSRNVKIIACGDLSSPTVGVLYFAKITKDFLLSIP